MYERGDIIRYGLPYKGSKNAIAEWIVEQLPEGDVLVDMFCGGGAITHAAMLSRKWKRFIMNDIDGRLPILFKDCAYGKYTTKTHPEWIDRKTFHERKEDDAYIALVWSFGNNGKDYLYGENIEEFKHAYHILVFDNNPEPLRKFGYEIKVVRLESVIDRYYCYKEQIRVQTTSRQYGKYPFDLDSTVRQIEIERLQSLQSDYHDVLIPDNAVIYCDIPYSGTNCGKYGGFNHDDFYAWAEKQDNIFISEYSMPSDFIEVACVEKSVLSTANGDSGKAIEKLFTNKRTYDRYNGRCVNVQLSLI